MMPERSHGWIGVFLALGTLLPLVASGASAGVSGSELDRTESLLREWLLELPADSGVVIERERDRVLLRIPAALVFQPDSDSLQPDALDSMPLSATVRLLKQRRLLSARIMVYTDSIGGAGANSSFSKARAKTLCSALHSAGISTFRLRQRGGGQSHALASNATPEGRLENRRVEIAFQRAAS
jgi:outer membrane protein OmpA-like peptidoglycan-associated protein